ncbi:MAG: OmpA family protein [Deltaproteobacteria bacterium]|nr:OmpA family protein [Deltaproteobacteria bacterium]
MMKRSWGWVGLMALVLCLSVSWMTGCAKKASLKEGAVVTQEQKVVAQTPAEASAAAADDQAARERALQEQALRDQAAREAAAKEAKDAADRAKKEAAAKAAAILKELQIADVNFDYNMYNLRPEAQDILKKGAPAYLKYRDYKLVVEGHCDERGTAEYNLALGEKRATEAAKYLADLGIEKERIKTIRAHFVIFPPVK